MKNIISVHSAGFERRKQWPELFNFDTWRDTDLYRLAIMPVVGRTSSVIDIGCLTGHHLQVLREDGRNGRFVGVDYCKGAIDWATERCSRDIEFINSYYTSGIAGAFDVAIATDVLEHVVNQGDFLSGIRSDILERDGVAVISVPKGTHYRDEGHVNFYPDMSALENLLGYWFTIEQGFEIDNGQRLVCICKAGAA